MVRLLAQITQYNKARFDLLPEMNIFETVARLKTLASKLDHLDLLNPTSKTIGIQAEIISRIQGLDIEPVDMSHVEC